MSQDFSLDSLIIRRMRLEDVESVVEIDRLSFSLPWSERAFCFEVNENPLARPWVAEWDGRVVAMLILWLVLDEAHIATIATHPDYRQLGIARRLLTEALRSAQEEGAHRAFLEVRAGNLAAQAMYTRMGFVMDGCRPHYYRDNGEDAILMSRTPVVLEVE